MPTRSSGAPKPLKLGHGFAVLYQPTLTVRGADTGLEYDVEMELAEEEGRLVCVALQVERKRGGDPVTADALKRLPVVGLIEEAYSGGLGLHKLTPGGARPVRQSDLDRLPDLRRVALIYRAAFAVGHPPTRAVAEGFSISAAAAAKRVQAARRAGELNATDFGKKGR